MSELMRCTNWSYNPDPFLRQRPQVSGPKQLHIVRRYFTSALCDHCPCELLQPLETHRLSVGSSSSPEHSLVERDPVSGQWRMIRIGAGKLGDKPQVVS